MLDASDQGSEAGDCQHCKGMTPAGEQGSAGPGLEEVVGRRGVGGYGGRAGVQVQRSGAGGQHRKQINPAGEQVSVLTEEGGARGA